jgi:hypothetical protein
MQFLGLLCGILRSLDVCVRIPTSMRVNSIPAHSQESVHAVFGIGLVCMLLLTYRRSLLTCGASGPPGSLLTCDADAKRDPEGVARSQDTLTVSRLVLPYSRSLLTFAHWCAGGDIMSKKVKTVAITFVRRYVCCHHICAQVRLFLEKCWCKHFLHRDV